MQKPPMGVTDEASNVSSPVSEKCLRNPEWPLFRREGKGRKTRNNTSPGRLQIWHT